jgi:two-component system chemotaxis response regulator CheY
MAAWRPKETHLQKNALIVDKESKTRELVEKVLTSAGFGALSIPESAEASYILRKRKFELAFLDYGMAPPDGPELAQQMRDSSCNRATPIILLSDDQRPKAMARGFEAGASFFLYKPIDKDRLQRLVRATQGAIEHEARRTRRVALKSKLLLRYRGQEIEGETIDVCMQGLLVKAHRVIPIGSSVEFSLNLTPAMKPIVGTCSVVRLDGENQMGIHLGRLSLSESQRLQEFLLPLVP